MDTEEIDLNKDGKINKEEEAAYERKAANRRKMAWVSLIALISSAFCLMFLVSESRIEKIKDILDFYWIALGSIVGAYVGISTWMTKK